MNINDYVTQALRSEAASTSGDTMVLFGARAAAVRAIIGAGALADALKKSVVYGKDIDLSVACDQLAELVFALALELRCEKKSQPGEERPFSVNFRLLHAALGIAGEAAELLEARSSDVVNIGEELGDAAWYLALGMDEVRQLSAGGIQPSGILAANIRKLQLRYPDKFTLAASENRNVAAERATLEKMT